jgi:tRNA pseudouridine55 synthase
VNGILLVDKPAGWTSHDVVAKVRGIIKAGSGQKIKTGHTGTLDPSATGLMVIVLGSFTKRASEFSKMNKTYEAELTLGAVSTTGDSEGEILKKSTQKPLLTEIEHVMNKFIGEIDQVPPIFSAIKVGGQRSYKLARQGKELALEPRQITIHAIENVKYDYPKISFTTFVSSGTYIRSLAEDIGKELGTGAYLSSLRRTKVGKFKIENALKIDSLSLPSIKQALQK